MVERDGVVDRLPLETEDKSLRSWRVSTHVNFICLFLLPDRSTDVLAAFLQGPLPHGSCCGGVTKSSLHAISLGLFAVCGKDTLVF